jgi:hypothetical protein
MTELETLTIIVKEKGCDSIRCLDCYYAYGNTSSLGLPGSLGLLGGHNCNLLKLEKNPIETSNIYPYIFRKAKIRLKEIKLEKIAND